MSKKDQLEVPAGTVVSTVVTRSQSSRASFHADGLDIESQPRVGNVIIKKQPSIKKASSRKSSKLDMALFGDVELEGGGSSGSSSETGQENEEVSSVGSYLHVSLEDIQRKKEREAAKQGSKASSKVGSVGSLTKSELIRINLEIKKLELEWRKLELNVEGRKLEVEDRKEERKLKERKLQLNVEERKLNVEERKLQLNAEERKEERKFKLKKLELLGKQEESRRREKVEINVEKPKFESSLSHEKITINSTSMRAEVPRMYEDKFNLDNYLIVFERLAVAQGWSRDIWVSRLTTQFNAKCQDIFSRIPVDLCQEYDTVKQKLLEGYNLGPETYRKSFKQLERNQNENFKDFAVKLEEIFSKWLKGVDCNSFEQLSQILLLEKFYSSIPKELVALLKDKKVTNLDEASKLADQFDSYREKIFSNQGPVFARGNGSFKNYPLPQSNNRESRFDSLRGSKQLASQDFKPFGKDNFNKFRGENVHKDGRASSHNSYHNRRPWHNNNENSQFQKNWRFDNRERNNAASLNYPNKSVNSFRNKVNFVKSDSHK